MSNNFYELPSEDIEYLNANYLSAWRKNEENGKFGLIIERFSLPAGYTVEQSDLMLIIPQGYPGTNLDMFYFAPALAKSNQQAIAALQSETHFERTWQRWSRHYPWRPGIDSIISHIEYIKYELEHEAQK